MLSTSSEEVSASSRYGGSIGSFTSKRSLERSAASGHTVWMEVLPE